MKTGKIYIGLIGEKLSGKETFVQILRGIWKPEPSIAHLRSGDVIGDILDILNIPRSRENMQDLPIVLIGWFGNGTITEAMRKRIQCAEGDTIIFDGIRRKTDAEMLKSIGGILIYITANAETRYKRTRKRKEKKGENSVSWEKFLEEDRAKIEQEIPEIGESAHYRIDNNGTLTEFRDKIRQFYLEYTASTA